MKVIQFVSSKIQRTTVRKKKNHQFVLNYRTVCIGNDCLLICVIYFLKLLHIICYL